MALESILHDLSARNNSAYHWSEFQCHANAYGVYLSCILVRLLFSILIRFCKNKTDITSHTQYYGARFTTCILQEKKWFSVFQKYPLQLDRLNAYGQRVLTCSHEPSLRSFLYLKCNLFVS